MRYASLQPFFLIGLPPLGAGPSIGYYQSLLCILPYYGTAISFRKRQIQGVSKQPLMLVRKKI